MFKQNLIGCIYFLFFSSIKSTIIIKCISKYQLQIKSATLKIDQIISEWIVHLGHYKNHLFKTLCGFDSFHFPSQEKNFTLHGPIPSIPLQRAVCRADT